MTITTTTGGSTTRELVVPGASARVVGLARTGPAGFAAVSVLVMGASVGVEETSSGPSGSTAGSCATAPARRQYLALGSTLGGRNIALALYNPTSTPAVANVEVSTGSAASSIALEQPAAFQGIPLGAGQLEVLDVGHWLPGRRLVATEVNTSGGGVVAGELLSVPSTTGVEMSSLVGGIQLAGPSWSFAAAPSGTRAPMSFAIFNPSSRSAAVKLLLESPRASWHETVSVPSGGVADVVGPISNTVPTLLPKAVPKRALHAEQRAVALARAFLAARETPQMPSARVFSVSGVPIVVEESLTVLPGVDARVVRLNLTARRIVVASGAARAARRASAAAASSRRAARAVSMLPTLAPGTASSSGEAAPGKVWLFAAGESSRRTGELLSITNPGSTVARVVVTRLTARIATGSSSPSGSAAASVPSERLCTLEVRAGASVTVDLDYLVGEPGPVALVVSGSEPLLVGELLYARGSARPEGLASPPAIPVG